MTDQDEKTTCNSATDLVSAADSLIKISAYKNEERANRLMEDGEDYNIFDVLNLATNEVNGHSRFLHHLLSPRGSHGMGDSFLKAFLKQVLDIEPEPWMSEARVDREVAFEDGRLDILVEHPHTCCIVIEVKVYADDQHRQLERYSNFIDSWKKMYPEASVVEEIYLTLDGREASDCSLGDSQPDYIPLSFKDGIASWLEKCIELSGSKPRVSEAIKQYLDIINQLTRRAVMDAELEYITEMVGESKINYEAAVQIEDSLSQVRIRLLQKIFNDIEKHLESRFSTGSNLTKDAEREEIKKYYIRDERRRPYPRLKYKIKEDGDRVLAFVVELWDRLWIGTVFFERADNEWGFKRIDNKREWLYALAPDPSSEGWRAIVDNAPAEDWWLDWRIKDMSPTDEGCIDFRHCMSVEGSSFQYSDLYDPQQYDSFINLVYRGIDGYLEHLKELGILD